MAFTFTANQLLSRANRLMGVIAGEETMPADVADDSLVILNSFLDSLTTQRLALPSTSREVFNYTANVNTYLIGPGQTWNTTRPTAIDFAAVLAHTASPAFEIPMEVIDDQGYYGIVQKDLTGIFPVKLYYNATNLVSGSVFVWYTPTDASNYQQVLYTSTQLSQFAGLTTSVTMAPGYYRMLYYNVAVELGMAFSVPSRGDVLDKADKSLKDIKRLNVPMLDLPSGAALPGADGIYNIYSDGNS